MHVTSRLAQLVERVTSNDEVSRSSRLMGISFLFVLVMCTADGRCSVSFLESKSRFGRSRNSGF